MANAQKKAVIRLLDETWLAGYLPSIGFARQGSLDFLDLTARRQTLPMSSVKWACFVRDFNSGEPANPERLLRTTFSSRPRLAGVWLRTVLTDGSTLEGVATNDLSLVHSPGLLLTPPDIRSNTQRIFLPHTSITELTVVAIIGAAAATAPAKRKPPASARGQADLFPAAPPRAL